MTKATTTRKPLMAARLVLCAGLAVPDLSVGLAHAQAAGVPNPASLASTDQTSYLTAVLRGATASDGADYETVLNANGLFISVTDGTVVLPIPGSWTITLDSGDAAVLTGDASRGTFIDMLNGVAEVTGSMEAVQAKPHVAFGRRQDTRLGRGGYDVACQAEAG